MTRLISQAEYARRRGISREAVRKAVAQGRITLVRGKIDAKKADAQWSTRTLPRVGATKKPAKPVPRPGRQPVDGGANGADNSYLAARTRREAAAAEIAELDLKERMGVLVRADQVRERVFKAARVARDLVLGITDRLAPRLVGQDELGIRKILDEEIGRVCDVIANAPSL